MRDALVTYLRSTPGTALHDLAERILSRDGELEVQREEGPDHELMSYAVQLETAAGQLRLELTGYDTRANVRLEVAEYLERIVLPEVNRGAPLSPKKTRPEYGEFGEELFPDPPRSRHPLDRIAHLPQKLRDARRQCWFQMDLTDGGTRTLWDEKAGEPLLCPDDAREEAMRLQRRLEETVEELARSGRRIYYGVLTIENAAPGHLATRIEKLWRKFKRALKRSGEPIEGAIATLEAPLSASRTWHPHLNVILVTDGYFDYAAWWKHWGCVSHFEHLKPGHVAAAFRELVKYAVRAVPEKSAAKAASCSALPRSSGSPASSQGSRSDGRSAASPTEWTAGKTGSPWDGGTAMPSGSPKKPWSAHHEAGPAMVEWTAAEWIEWWCAMKGRRRTRTYGELYGLNVEPEEDQGRWVTIGKGRWAGTGYEARFALLECIPGDKSITNIAVRYRNWLASLEHPPNIDADLYEQVRSLTQMIEFERMEA